MSVPVFTTPTFTLTFTEQTLNLTEAESVYVTFRSGSYFLTKTGTDLTVEQKSISVALTQEETAQFQTPIVEIQANWIMGGRRAASEVVGYDITQNLLARVVE